MPPKTTPDRTYKPGQHAVLPGDGAPEACAALQAGVKTCEAKPVSPAIVAAEQMTRMYIVYLDESGDSGGPGSPTEHFIMGGLAVHVDRWHEAHDALLRFRKRTELRHGLGDEVEMHAAEFLGAAISHRGLGRVQRLGIAREWLSELGQPVLFRTFGWWIQKTDRLAAEKIAEAVIEDLDRWAAGGLLSDSPPKTTRYVLVHDVLGRRPEAWHRLDAGCRIERSFSENSSDSLFLQGADFVAYAIRQHLRPNRFLATRGGKSLIRRLDANCLGLVHVPSAS